MNDLIERLKNNPTPETIQEAIEELNDISYNEALQSRMSVLLTKAVNIIRGDPNELSLHSWHDLPDLVQELVDELKERDSFINDAFTAHPNLDRDVEHVRKGM